MGFQWPAISLNALIGGVAKEPDEPAPYSSISVSASGTSSSVVHRSPGEVERPYSRTDWQSPGELPSSSPSPGEDFDVSYGEAPSSGEVCGAAESGPGSSSGEVLVSSPGELRPTYS